MQKDIAIIDTTLDNISRFGVCGYKNLNKEGFPEKMAWLKNSFKEGLKIKTVFSEKDGTQGMIEYVPGKYCWRPVKADDYMFIHCLFVGFKRSYKNLGIASTLIKECEKDSRAQEFKGIAVVTRKGSFMVGKEIFLKHGFSVVDTVKPDFELMVKKFTPSVADPKFKITDEKTVPEYPQGLTIIRASQCPYTVKNVKEIIATAQQDYGLQPKVIELKTSREAQSSPCAFGIFCIIYEGRIIAEHPISKGRFINIMNRINKDLKVKKVLSD